MSLDMGHIDTVHVGSVLASLWIGWNQVRNRRSGKKRDEGIDALRREVADLISKVSADVLDLKKEARRGLQTLSGKLERLSNEVYQDRVQTGVSHERTHSLERELSQLREDIRGKK